MDKAIINNNFEKFIKLLPSISDINYLYNGYSLLYLACKHNHVDFVKRMIQKGANVNFMINNTTPLSLAMNLEICSIWWYDTLKCVFVVLRLCRVLFPT